MKLLERFFYTDINLIYFFDWELRKIIKTRNSFEKMGKEIPAHYKFFAELAEIELNERGNKKRKLFKKTDSGIKKIYVLSYNNLKNFLVKYQMRRIIKNNLKKNRRLK